MQFIDEWALLSQLTSTPDANESGFLILNYKIISKEPNNESGCGADKNG